MKRVVVVGASSGLGRCIGIGLAKRGARVALLARRKQRLVDAAREAGNDALAIACDATDAASCQAAIALAAEGLGGIDTVVYAAAVGPLVRLADADAATWRRAFDTNVLGAALVTAAALPQLAKSSGNVLYMSTSGASYTPPWPGLGVYQVTKAALERLADAWRAEHPGVGFTRVIVGECRGGEGDAQTQFIKDWDMSLMAELGPIWLARNYLGTAMIDVDHLVGMFDALVNAGPSLQTPSITLLPRPALPKSA